MRGIMIEVEHNSQLEFFRNPAGAVACGGEVTLRLAVKNAGIPHSVRMICIIDDKTEEFDMAYVFSAFGGSVYETTVTISNKPCIIWYYFEIVTDDGVVYYGNNKEALGGKGASNVVIPENKFQITVFDDEYKTPDWFKNAVAYQIFPDRFYNGNNGEFLGNRDDIIKREWGDVPFYKAEQFGGEYKANDFFGGNLSGIIEKLPYLEDLGITVIYLNPIFKASSNHKYDTGSYEEIDEMFGDEETFSRLCDEAKKRGIRIILDGVFNHTGDDSVYFNKYGKYDSIGAYQSKDSPYYSWYNFTDFPDEYESWWGIKTLPQIDEGSEALRRYIITDENSIVKKWLRLGASGWRLDVVDELPDFFVKELRWAVKEVDEDAVIIGEVWEDASNKVAYGKLREYFCGDELDSVMNYPMRRALIDMATGKIDAELFDMRIMSLKENYPDMAYKSLLNMMSSHDVERIMTLMGDAPSRHEVDKDFQASFRLMGEAKELAKKRTMAVWGIVMTMPGVPCLFYGDELGAEGYGDPFCRSCFPWDNMSDGEYMRNWIKKLIALRKSSEAFSQGEFMSVYKIGRIYAYVRSFGNEKYLVVASFDDKKQDIRIDAARSKIKRIKPVLSTHRVSGEDNSKNGIFFESAEPYSVTIYACE